MRHGHLYILINGSMPGLVKIGHSWRSPREEARELSEAADVPMPFTVAWEEELIRCDEADRVLQTRLDRHRFPSNRDFFSLPLQEAIQTAKEVAHEFRQHERLNMENPGTPKDNGPRLPTLRASDSAKRALRKQVLTRIGVGLFLGPICAIYAWFFGLSNIAGVLLLLLAIFYFGAVLAAPFFQMFACPICGNKTRVTYFSRSCRCDKCGVVHVLEES